MKNTKNFVLLLLAACILTIAMTSYKTPTFQDKHFLKVERQEWILQHMTGNIPSEEFDIGMTIDVPVGGDPVLMDSIMRLLNEAIYFFFEERLDPHFAPGELYCNDGRQLIQYYREAYKPYIEDTCEFHGCCPTFDYLSVTLVEQTKSFVTYEISNYFIGEGDCEYLHWTTFYKSDGHRLPKVINDKDLLKFLKGARGKDYDVWEDVEFCLSMGGDVDYRCDFGLTTDSLRFQYFYAPGIVETYAVDIDAVRRYLTKEAKRLLK